MWSCLVSMTGAKRLTRQARAIDNPVKVHLCQWRALLRKGNKCHCHLRVFQLRESSMFAGAVH